MITADAATKPPAPPIARPRESAPGGALRGPSNRTSGRIVGAFFLLAFVFYGAGSALVDAGSGAPAVLTDVAANQTLISAGVLLIFLNSIGVVVIGVVAFPVLARTHLVSAVAYLATRVFEAVMLTVAAVLTLLTLPLAREYVDAGASDGSLLPALGRVAQEGSQYAYWFAMTGLALGSVLFCRVLLRARLVPPFLAMWGVVGYAVLATGGVLELLGYDVGLVLSGPGGLFEIALGVLLVARGFPAAHADALEPDLSLAPVSS